MRVLAAAVVLLLAVPLRAARGPTEPSHDDAPSVQARTPSITGRWHGRGSGLSLTLTLVQHGDSIRGDGSYAAVHGAVGCGGETLPDTGRVALTGELVQTQLRAHLRFPGGWGPPFTASLVHPDTLSGRVMAMDRPACPLTLVRVR